MEEQQKKEKDKRKGDSYLSRGGPYPPININVLLSQSPVPRMEIPEKSMTHLQQSRWKSQGLGT
jgi:hypothetical protein